MGNKGRLLRAQKEESGRATGFGAGDELACQRALGVGADQIGSELDARENAAKITHGFWLQQYTWLHDQQQGRAGEAGGQSRSANKCEAESVGQKSRGRPKQRGGQRLLARWGNLMRSLGGSACNSPSKQHERPVSAGALGGRESNLASRFAGLGAAGSSLSGCKWRGGQRARPAATSANTSGSKQAELAASADEVCEQSDPGGRPKVGRRWFMGTISSSTSALLSPLSSSRRGFGASEPSSSGGQRSSPYRQIASVFQRRREQRAATTGDLSNRGATFETDSHLGTGERIELPPEPEVKRSKLMQCARVPAAACTGERARASRLFGGLLVSPLFSRRRKTGRAAATSSSAQLGGDKETEGGGEKSSMSDKREAKKIRHQEAAAVAAAAAEGARRDEGFGLDGLIEFDCDSGGGGGGGDQLLAERGGQLADAKRRAVVVVCGPQAAQVGRDKWAAQSGSSWGELKIQAPAGECYANELELEPGRAGERSDESQVGAVMLAGAEERAELAKEANQRETSAGLSPKWGQEQQSAPAGEQRAELGAPELAADGGPSGSDKLLGVQSGAGCPGERSLLPLIQPFAGSSSSLCSSPLLPELGSQQESSAEEEVCVARVELVGDESERRGQQQQQQRRPRPHLSRQLTLERPMSQPIVGLAARSSSNQLERPSQSQQESLQQPLAPTKGRLERAKARDCGAQADSLGGKQKAAQAASSGVGMLRSNFKKLVKRQQSVDSYRMARDLKNKLRRQQEARNKHKSKGAQNKTERHELEPRESSGRKFSMGDNGAQQQQQQRGGAEVKICVSGRADALGQQQAVDSAGQGELQAARRQVAVAPASKRVGPTPPSSLSLLPSAISLQQQQPGAFIVGSFSGCITPTYPTHHLPSPKYVAPASSTKKYSNASTVSSSFGADNFISSSNFYAQSRQAQNEACGSGGTATQHSDADSLLGGGSATPSRVGGTRAGSMGSSSPVNLLGRQQQQQQQQLGETELLVEDCDSRAAAAAAARRADLAEHIYDNKCGLGEDMKFLASLPELCDITFLVGETREPVCAVKSVLAARSRVFHKILFGNRVRKVSRQLQQAEEELPADDRRGSSPRAVQASQRKLAGRSSSPMAGRSSSPSQQQQQWSVTSNSSGYNAQLLRASSTVTNEEQSASLERTSRVGGRVSVTSNGRESASQASQGSQQPLIIGPGQVAAPAPQRAKAKKSSVREVGAGSRLSRMFTKRASDPSIKHNQSIGGANRSSSNYLDKMSWSQMSTTMIIEEFEPDVFRQLIEYIHTGCVLLQARTLLGLLNAADYYGLEQLRKACLRFVSCCITVDTVCSLLSTAERYIQYKCTKSIVQKVLEFVDTHADEIFKLNAFGLLPEHVVRLILARDGLKADEYAKYNGVYTWCEHYCRSFELTNISDVMQNFLDFIQFYKIPTNLLLSEIYPTHVVPDSIFLSALAYQADPRNFEPQPSQSRRMTLPNPSSLKDYDRQEQRGERKRKWSGRKASKDSSSGVFGSQQMLAQGGAGRGSRASGGGGGGGTGQSEPAAGRMSKLRKGSLAQVSLGGVVRLSHKLSIKKRHSNSASAGARKSAANKHQSALERTQTQVGQQILDAYLVQQRQRELELEELRLAEEAKLRSEQKRSESASSVGQQAAGALQQQQQQQLQQRADRQPVAKSSSNRKSFKDFRHISRRIFMRHSSNKLLQQSFNTMSSNRDGSENGNDQSCASGDQSSNAKDKDKGRGRLKIKRSETVFESSPLNARLFHQLSSNMLSK